MLLLCKAVSAGQGGAGCVVELSTGLHEISKCPEKAQGSSLSRYLIMKVLVGTFNKAKVPAEAFSGRCEISRVPLAAAVCSR